MTADTSGISDADGLQNASFSHQWLADDAEIPGATGSTYTLADADEAKAVKVRVSFIDDRDNEETLTSEATAAVSPAPGGEGDAEDGAKEYAPVWSATTTAGWVFQGYGYYSTDSKQAGSLTPDSFEADGAAYTVTMIEANGWLMYIGLDKELPFDFVLELDGAQFASGDASFNSYTYGNVYSWTGTGLSWNDGDAVEVRLLRAVEKEATVNVPATGAPAVTGTARVGETLTADASGIADEDGLDAAAFTYQWLADGADIAGATGSTYTLAKADAGKAVGVRVSFTDDAGNEETLTSAATDAVAGMPPAQPTGLSADLSVKQVTLTWDDPQDDTITGYVILRRIRGYDAEGVFTTHVADTGSAATTYTDDATEWETPYTYRIKSVNEHGTSERSRWVHVETPRPPALEGRKPLHSAGQRQVQQQQVQQRQVQQQNVEVLVSNIGQSDDDSSNLGTYAYGQAFTVGADGGDYTVESVELVIGDEDILATDIDKVTVSVWSADSSGRPETSLFQLTNPASTSAGDAAKFSAPSGARVEAGKTYIVTVDYRKTSTSANVRVTDATAEDAGSKEGWSIANHSLYQQHGETSWTIYDPEDNSFRIRVNGTPATQVWSGTVTVGGIESSGDVIAYGFSGSTGSLDDTEFTVEGTDFAIDGIYVGKDGVSTREGKLYFSLGSTPTAADEAALVLHAGGKEYVLTDRDTKVDASFTYAWNDTGLDWENKTSVTLRLTLQSVSENYQDSVDLPATTATIGRVLVGESARGKITPSGDTDWFRVELEADTTYRIDLEGSETGKGTLLDPWLSGIFDADGDRVPNSSNDDGGQGTNGLKIFTPTASGTYFIEVKDSTGVGTGTYTLSVKEPSDDATLSVLSVLNGATELVSSFAAGTTSYTASVDNSVTTVTVSATANDSGAEAVITPEDSDTNTMGHQVSLDVGSNTITVEVTAEDNSTQDYTVAVTRIITLVSNLDQPDSDQAGTSNKIAQEFTTGSNEDGYILSSVYVVSKDDEGDEFSASLCTAASGDVPSSTCTPLTSPSSFAKGTLTFTAPENTVLAKDTDYFVVFNPGSDEVTFGRVESDSEDAGAAAGWEIGNHYHFLNNMDVWAATATERSLLIAIKGYAVPGTPARFEEGDTDFAQDTSTAGVVEADGFASKGAISPADDYDWFRVELEVGRTYQIVLWGALVGRDLTLGIPAINGLHDSDGGFLPNTYADFTDEEDEHEHDVAVPVFGADAELIFSPGASGTYYVSVKGRGGYLGTYELWVADITEEDDAQPANTRTTTLLTRGGVPVDPVEGRIDYLGDQDWFAVTAVAGVTYQVDMEGRDTGKGSLSDPYLRVYISSGGQAVQVGTGNDDGGVGYNARITFTSGQYATYFVAAQGFGRIGTYTLTLKEVED